MSLQLLDLPTEILLSVANELSSPELHSLRVVCRQLDQVAFDLVSRKYFAPLEIKPTRNGLQRLYIISKEYRLNRCVQSLRIVDGLNHYEKSERGLWTTIFLEDTRRATTRLELQTLELDAIILTPEMLRAILFASSDSLRTLRIHDTRITDCGRWPSLFADMVGKFPRLRTVTVDHPREFRRHTGCFAFFVDFSKFAEYPVMPGIGKEWSGLGLGCR